MPIADGAHLRAGRAALGLSQADLAELSGLSRPTIDRLERRPGDFERAAARTLRVLEQALLMRGATLDVVGDERIVRWRASGDAAPSS